MLRTSTPEQSKRHSGSEDFLQHEFSEPNQLDMIKEATQESRVVTDTDSALFTARMELPDSARDKP